jgi:hypothetical protein
MEIPSPSTKEPVKVSGFEGVTSTVPVGLTVFLVAFGVPSGKVSIPDGVFWLLNGRIEQDIRKSIAVNEIATFFI